MKTKTKLAYTVAMISIAILGACSSSSSFVPSGNPLLDLRNPELMERDRITAARAAWAEVEQGVRDRERTRYAMKNLAWSGGTDADLRLVILDLLLSDQSEAGSADSRVMARLLLPNERDVGAVRIISKHAVQSDWNELIPAFVRSLARPIPGVALAERSEFDAIQALSNGQSIEQVVFDVFLNPNAGMETDQERAVLKIADRTRDEAWGLLGRMDPSGELRDGLISSAITNPGDADPESLELLKDLRVAQDELAVLPTTSLEISWLSSLRHHSDERNREANSEWWVQSSRAVRSLSSEQRTGLRLRHIEPVRWVNEHRSQWLSLSRDDLYALLSSRLRDRTVHKRKSERGEPPRLERLGDWSNQMSWGDLLTVLVLDESLLDQEMQTQIFTHRTLDKQDTSTEYGGVIESAEGDDWRAILFRPRQRDRLSDVRFVASDDMFRFSDRSLAHYHFHANDRNSSRFAGPSMQDLQNALNSQRTSVVFTSLDSTELNVDVYFGNGVVIDLGTIEQ